LFALNVEFRTLIFWRMYQMSGLAFIFIPISILSYVGVPRDKSNQVSGISNFIRNLGSSVGISMTRGARVAKNRSEQRISVSAHLRGCPPQKPATAQATRCSSQYS
jgi:DHA2 family multidrug resistance protein